jgi:hypothetical protein
MSLPSASPPSPDSEPDKLLYWGYQIMQIEIDDEMEGGGQRCDRNCFSPSTDRPGTDCECGHQPSLHQTGLDQIRGAQFWRERGLLRFTEQLPEPRDGAPDTGSSTRDGVDETWENRPEEFTEQEREPGGSIKSMKQRIAEFENLIRKFDDQRLTPQERLAKLLLRHRDPDRANLIEEVWNDRTEVCYWTRRHSKTMTPKLTSRDLEDVVSDTVSPTRVPILRLGCE